MTDGSSPSPERAQERVMTTEEVRNKVVLEAFQAAWGARDIDALAALISHDMVYAASTGPEPGTTWTGRDQVVAGFRTMLARDPGNSLAVETIYAGSKAFATWSIEAASGQTGAAVRGCDLFEFRDGRITAKDAFRKSSAPSQRPGPLTQPPDATIQPLIYGHLLVRPFTHDDVSELLEMMKGLARFEGYIDDFAITEVDLIEFGLGANPLFEALVATTHDDKSSNDKSSNDTSRNDAPNHDTSKPLVASRGAAAGQLLGMAVMYRLPWSYDLKPKLVMKELFVPGNGRSRGVGKALLRAVTERARQLSASGVNWTVLHDNERAKQFYRTNGGRPDAKWHPWTLDP